MDSFEVENFRSLKHLKLEKLARVNLLVGKNNSGKTSALESLYMFTSIEYNNWIRDIEQDRNQQTGETDFRYIFYKFNGDNNISMQANYKSNNSLQELHLHINAKINNQITFSDIPEKTSRAYRVQTGRRDSSSSVLTVNIEPGNNLPSFGFDISTSRLPTRLSYNPHSEQAEKFIANGWDSIASARRNVFSLPTSIEKADLSEELGDLVISKQIEQVVTLVKRVDNRINSIQLAGNGQIYIDLEGFDILSPLEIIGEGIQKLITIIAAIVNTRGGSVLIDEIDNGLHYSALRILWRGILQAAREYDVQVFATTHSAEALRHLTWVLDDDCKEYRNDVVAYTLIRADDDTVRSYRHDYEQLDYALDHGVEVRN